MSEHSPAQRTATTAKVILGTGDLPLRPRRQPLDRGEVAPAGRAEDARTRRLAVRQERWFRRDPGIVWVDLDDGATTDDAVAATLNAVAVATDRMGAFRPCT